MIELCPVERGGTPDEVGTVGALLMGPDGGGGTGSDKGGEVGGEQYPPYWGRCQTP